MFHVCLNLYDLFQQSRGMTVQELERGFHGMSLDHGQVSGFKATTKNTYSCFLQLNMSGFK